MRRPLLFLSPLAVLSIVLACSGGDDAAPSPTPAVAGAGGGGAGGGAGGSAGKGGGAGKGVGGGGPAGFDLSKRPANKTCLAFERPATGASIKLEPFAPQLKFTLPVLLLQAPGDAARFFVVEKTGKVQVFQAADMAQKTTFFDLGNKVNAGPGEAGFLGFAFHPDFAANGVVFASYTDSGGATGLRSVIARYKSSDGGKTVDVGTEQVVLTRDQPYENHNGGMIAFGPDRRLYISLGDGGSGGDPLNSGQDTDTLLGKILRIDVDGASPYAIPPDNPFAQGGGKPEIFAWGLRNVWRFSFDRGTGDLWAGDVGQNTYEEVDVVKLGGNYGWRVMEGFHCYNAASCDQSGLTLPVVEYDHSVGQSITGGYVYRGKAIPSLVGRYVYADYVSGRIWAVKDDPITGKASGELLLEAGFNVSSFGEDLDGELYVLDYKGSLRKLTAAGAPQPSKFPEKLSQTGCFDPADPTRPAAGLIPYDINAPFWSDGAEKRRWFAVPDGKAIDVNAAGDLDLPVGSVTVKEFILGGRRIETRLLVRHDDGGWAGYSYEWDDAQTDATYVAGGKTKVIDGQSWLYPSSAQCLRCHAEVAGRTLGLELGQLNRDVAYAAGVSNQITALDKVGYFSQPLAGPVASLPRLAEPQGAAPLLDRARSHLHTNCAFCHQPGGTGQGEIDFRHATSFAAMKVCDVAPSQGDLGVAGARLIAPGDPSKSIVSLRVRALDSKRMPPLGSHVVDGKGADMLDQFITSLQGCAP